MSRFYVTLPSNSSMDCYPDNSVARFTTKLNIELVGDWEVGLTEISFPSDIRNVLDGHCYYTIRVEDQFFRKITLDAKHYASIRDHVCEMNGKQQMSIGEVDLFVGVFISNGKIGMTFQYQTQVKSDRRLQSGLGSSFGSAVGRDVRHWR